MSGAKLGLLPIILLLTTLSSRAQGGKEPDEQASKRKTLTVQLTLPTVVGVIGEYIGILGSKDKGKIKTLTSRDKPHSTSNPVLLLTVPVPGVFTDSKPKPEKK